MEGLGIPQAKRNARFHAPRGCAVGGGKGEVTFDGLSAGRTHGGRIDRPATVLSPKSRADVSVVPLRAWQVSLTHSEKEIFVWVGEGLVGLGMVGQDCRNRHLDVRKVERQACGARGWTTMSGEVRSRAGDSVAFCMAWTALAKYKKFEEVKSHKRPGAGNGGGEKKKECGKRILKILDPMCGVGTFLSAAACVANKLNFGLVRAPCVCLICLSKQTCMTNFHQQVMGCDADEVSIDVAESNLRYLADGAGDD
eukprot:767140-Hanusia_phi.AAC.3